MCHWLIAVGR